MKPLTKIILVVFFLFSVLSVMSSVSYAEIPHLINYQGRLTDSTGKPLEGLHDLTFRIYDAENAGNLLWEETHTSVIIQKGIFSVLLGSVRDLNLAFDKSYFLEIKVNNEVMSPRQRITSSAYAIRAEKAEDALTAEQAQNSTRAATAAVADAIKGSENIFLGSGNVGIGTASPSEKLDVQGGMIKLKGIRIDHVVGSNPICPPGTGATVSRKWDSNTISQRGSNTSCTTTAGWSVNTPTCQYEVISCNQYGEDCHWTPATLTATQWTEAICMGN